MGLGGASQEVAGFKVIWREAKGGEATNSMRGGGWRGQFLWGTDQSATLSEIPTYFSLFACKKNPMTCTT